MAGHWHDPTAATQNQGNQLGSRPCVRQSQLFRQNESGNTMKSLLGSSHLQWDTKHTQGAYAGRPAYDAASDYAAQTSIQGKYHCARRRPTASREGIASMACGHLEISPRRPRDTSKNRRRERDDKSVSNSPQEGVGRPGAL